MPNNTSSPREATNKPSFFMTAIIWLLTTAIKFRKAGLIFLFAIFLINCYLMLFDQQSYITLLEHYFSPDGHISNINSVFFKIQTTLIFTSIFCYLIDQPSIDLIKEQSLHDESKLNWRQRPLPYILACILWLLISYLPFLFLDHQTIMNSIRDDGFYQNFGAAFLFIAAILFFYLFYRDKGVHQPVEFKKGRNIWFLLLGILFLFGAGEEISWGQRIFHFPTPAFMSSNVQGEFTIHNLPLFDGRSEKPSIDTHGFDITTRTIGYETFFTSAHLLKLFCFFSFIILPISCLINSNARKITNYLRLPSPPIFLGAVFLFTYNLHSKISYHYNVAFIQAKHDMSWGTAKEIHGLLWASTELYETAISFLFMITALFLMNNIQKIKKTIPLFN